MFRTRGFEKLKELRGYRSLGSLGAKTFLSWEIDELMNWGVDEPGI